MTDPINLYLGPQTNKIVPRSYLSFHWIQDFLQEKDYVEYEAFGDLYVPSIIECAKELNKDPKLFKTIYLKETSYANLDRLLNFSKQWTKKPSP